MSYAFKILGQAVGDGSLNDIYTVPSETQAIIGKIVIAETANGTPTYTVALAPSGASAVDKHLIANTVALTARQTVEIGKGATLTETDVIRFNGSTSAVTCQVWGVEINNS